MAKSIGVFCLEGSWSSKLTDKSSVKPLLEVLHDRREAKFVHKDVATIEEFKEYVGRWKQQQYRSYRIGAFCFHGKMGGIYIGRKFVALDELAEILGGACAQQVIHFDSCGTLATSPKAVEDFRRAVRARAVTGYTHDVDWMESAAFLLNYIFELSSTTQVPTALKRLHQKHLGACRRLGFRAVWEGGRIPARWSA